MPNVRDPAAAALSLDIESLPRIGGVITETPSRESGPLADGHRGLLLRSPHGLLIKLRE